MPMDSPRYRPHRNGMISDPDRTRIVLQDMLLGGVRIEAIRPLTTGFSNETYLIDGPDLILRLPPSAGAMLDGHDVIAQAAIYRELGAAPGAPPVPRVVLTCDDAAVLGARFFVMERVAGESIHDLDLQPWFIEGSDAFRRDVAQRWVSVFGALARLKPLEVLGAPVSPEDDARTWQAFAQSANSPRLVEQYDRLLSRPAPRSGLPSVVHGDTKLSNLMWLDGQVSAVLDWEMALNGEPLADLGYMLYGFASPFHGATTPQKQPGMPDRDQVIAWWEAASGRSAEGVFWHEIAQIGKITAIIAEGTDMWLTGRSQDPKLAWFAKNLDYYLGVMAAMLDGGDF